RFSSSHLDLVMRKNHTERSSEGRVPISPPIIRPERTRAFLHDLVNVRDEQLDRLRRKYETLLGGFYTSNELALYRDELRLLWHPTDGIPEREWKEFDEWLKIRPAAEPGEMICNRWIGRSRVGLVAVWE